MQEMSVHFISNPNIQSTEDIMNVRKRGKTLDSVPSGNGDLRTTVRVNDTIWTLFTWNKPKKGNCQDSISDMVDIMFPVHHLASAAMCN